MTRSARILFYSSSSALLFFSLETIITLSLSQSLSIDSEMNAVDGDDPQICFVYLFYCLFYMQNTVLIDHFMYKTLHCRCYRDWFMD